MSILLNHVIAQATSGAGLLLLAQEEEAGASYGVAFGLLMLCVILGVLVAVRPDKRESDITR